jgi:hypothetical protein
MNEIKVNVNFIEQELKKFTVTDSVIAELVTEYKDLEITGLDDKAGYSAVRFARLKVKGYRVEVEHKRKELNVDAVEYKRRIDAEAKRISSQLEPLERKLHTQEQWFETEHENIKREKAEAKEKKNQERIAKLYAIGMTIKGTNIVLDIPGKLQIYELAAMTSDTDAQFHEIYTDLKFIYDEEQLFLKKQQEEVQLKWLEQQQALKKEQEALEIQRKEQEAERARLAEITRQQEAQAAILKAEADNQARQKWLEDETKRIAIEQEKAAREKLAQEAKVVEEKRIAAEKKEAARLARMPDKKKLEAYHDLFGEMFPAELTTSEAKKIYDDFESELQEILLEFSYNIEGL